MCSGRLGSRCAARVCQRILMLDVLTMGPAENVMRKTLDNMAGRRRRQSATSLDSNISTGRELVPSTLAIRSPALDASMR